MKPIEANDLADVLPHLPQPLQRHALEVLIDLAGSTSIEPTTLQALLAAYSEQPIANLVTRLERARRATLNEPSNEAAELDVLILAIKPVEVDACLAALSVPPGQTPTVLGTSGIVMWRREFAGFQVGVAMVGAAGNVETAVFLASLAERVSFKACVLVGMAAGVPGEVRLGSVVIAERVLAYEFMLMTAEGPRYEPKPYSPNERHFRNLMTLDLTPAFRTQVRDMVFAQRTRFEEFPADELESLDLWAGPKLKRGMLLAGGRLIEDGKLPEFAGDINSRVVGAEMEGAGFAAACTELEVPWMVLRGVADYGEPERRKHWQWPATYSAACLLLEGIARGYLFAGVVGDR